MALFGFGKERREGACSDLVMAYLEDVLRTRCPLVLQAKRFQAAGTLQGLEEAEGRMTLQVQGANGVERGGRLDLTFILDGIRLGAEVQVAEVRQGALVLDIPDTLELRERRRQGRVRLNPKEGATLTALTGLFEGTGITGVIENISEGGARIHIEKALDIKTERRLPLGTALVPVGQPFMLVKLNKVPKCPSVMELEGRAVYLEAVTGGMCLGLAFTQPRVDFAAALRNLVSSRGSAPPTAVPPKARRAPEQDSPQSSLLGDGPHRAHVPPPVEPPPAVRAPEPAPSAPPASVPAAAQEPAPIHPEPQPEPAHQTPPESSAPASTPLLRMKKRARVVVILCGIEGAGNELRNRLLEEGYGRVVLVREPAELFTAVAQPGVALAFIDAGLSELQDLEVAEALREHAQELPIVLAAEHVSASFVIAAHRAGVSQLLVKPYALDAAFSALLEAQMGID